MRKAIPLPRDVSAAEVADRIAARHKDDDLGLEAFPDPENIAAVVDFALRRRTRLSRVDSQANVLDALLLVRCAREQLDRLEKRALLTAKADRIKTRQLAPITGIRTRQGIHDRIRALTRKIGAARLGVPPEALDESSCPTVPPEEHVRAIAETLLGVWPELETDPDIDEWAEGIELVLRSPHSPSATASLITQMRIAVAEIDELAARTGRPSAASTVAREAMEAVRKL
ncbi:hypothetical protein ACSNOI_25660 [Actinomadura kijaniata]|uniref:hypothetical protein n=1 Tax=Actinomadura kijaniata TaxID=46161 RepID=UPI003F19D35A